jgi:DNA-binding CsgD family transcriptional regulator
MVFNRNERLILRELANGHAAAEIAECLEMSVSTVGRHLRSAIHKAGLNNRYQLLVFLFQSPRALLKKGRFAPGLHDQATCDCPCCRNMTLDMAALDDVPSVRQAVDLARSPITGVSSPVAGLPNFPRG